MLTPSPIGGAYEAACSTSRVPLPCREGRARRRPGGWLRQGRVGAKAPSSTWDVEPPTGDAARLPREERTNATGHPLGQTKVRSRGRGAGAAGWQSTPADDQCRDRSPNSTTAPSTNRPAPSIASVSSRADALAAPPRGSNFHTVRFAILASVSSGGWLFGLESRTASVRHDKSIHRSSPAVAERRWPTTAHSGGW